MVNSTQTLHIRPEADMVLKVSSKEAYGVNMAISLCSADHNCRDHHKSQQIGNTEVLMAQVKAGSHYYLKLDYSHSIV